MIRPLLLSGFPLISLHLLQLSDLILSLVHFLDFLDNQYFLIDFLQTHVRHPLNPPLLRGQTRQAIR
jgi:hypothetical protein